MKQKEEDATGRDRKSLTTPARSAEKNTTHPGYFAFSSPLGGFPKAFTARAAGNTPGATLAALHGAAESLLQARRKADIREGAVKH